VRNGIQEGGIAQPTRLPLQLWWHACRVRNEIEEGDKTRTGFVRLFSYHLFPFRPAAVADILGDGDKAVVELVA
jgi:hypothetical protein